VTVYAPQVERDGTSTKPITVSGGAHNFRRNYFRSRNASGDVRATYEDLEFKSTASGETLRLRGIANATGVAAGGTVNAIHATGRIASSATVSGALNAIRATLEVAGTSPTPGGTLSALQLDVSASASTTWGGEDAYVRVTDSGSTALTNLFNFTAAAASNDPTVLVSTHADHASTHLIKCRVAGADLWLLATNAH
jgi:hypothetical protein